MSEPTTPSSPSPKPDRRAEAARRNAQKSTGPRTPEGKARSSMNAVKHGLTAQAAVLPGEDPDELESLARLFTAQLKPMGPLQRLLVERIISLTWKLRRVSRAEVAAARQMDAERLSFWETRQELALTVPGYIPRRNDHRPKTREAGALLAASFEESASNRTEIDGPLVRLTKYELKLDAALRAAMRELRALQKEEAFAAPEGEAEETMVEEPAAEAAPPAAAQGGTEGQVLASVAPDVSPLAAPEQNELNGQPPTAPDGAPPVSGA